MASLANDGGNKWRILFGNPPHRKLIRYRGPRDKAERFRDRVARLVLAQAHGESPEADLKKWLADMPDELHGRLVKVELVKPRDKSTMTLGAFIDLFLSGRTDLKAGTRTNFKQVKRWLLSYFEAGRDLASISANDAENFRLHLIDGGLGENSIRRHIGRSRQLFKAAIRRGLYHGNNPFDGMAATVRADKDRQRFIDRPTIDKVLAKCPNTTWRLIVSLSRYGGLRCPSETLALRWSDIDFDNGRIRVPSCKTENYAGKGERVIPMFPELRPVLEQALGEQVLSGEPDSKPDFVIDRYRSGTKNLRTQFQRIVRKAGVTPWPKLFHNLRASRQTELCNEFPLHVVCNWLGNSKGVAMEHYLQVTDAHFERATGAAQFAAQCGAQSSETEGKSQNGAIKNRPDFPGDFTPLHSLQSVGLTPTGFEPVSRP